MHWCAITMYPATTTIPEWISRSQVTCKPVFQAPTI